MKLKRLILYFLLFIPLTKSYSQYWDNEVSSKYFFGGTGGLSLGTVSNVEIAPMAGMNFTPKLCAGVSLIYQYYNNKPYNFNTSFFGGRLFSEFVVFNGLYEILPIKFFDNIFLHGEYEFLGIEGDYVNFISSSTYSGLYTINSAIFGVGIGLPMGRRSNLKISVLTNFSDVLYYPYEAPIFRFDLHIYLKKSIPKKYYNDMD